MKFRKEVLCPDNELLKDLFISLVFLDIGRMFENLVVFHFCTIKQQLYRINNMNFKNKTVDL